mgnify:CR=1 FL=1
MVLGVEYKAIMDKTVRKSNIELLRIISMLMIIAYHLYIHGVRRIGLVSADLQNFLNDNVINKVFSMVFAPGGEIGVGLFFMITGYFLHSKTSGRVAKIFIRCVFYSLISILIILLNICMGGGYDINSSKCFR